ncbi:MAG TPA: hypothetical protein VFA18_20295, partial [Gemmataceae bacterium]|nr:hypothetical protein [Gemmataceae bacterium]
MMCRLVLVLLLALACMPVQAQEQDQARAILDRALHAVGADRSAGPSSAATWTTKVTVHGLGDPIVYVSEWAFRSPERVRVRMTGTFHGRPFERLLVINGDHGWIKQEDTIQELDRDRLTEEKERLYAAWVATLIPLRAADFNLTALHRNKAGHQQLGLRVKQAGHRAVVLYFDEAGRLAESETRRKDPTSG